MHSFIYPISTRGKTQKVCILVHGLNFNPDSMQEIANEFLNHSYIICLVRLSGHTKCENLSSSTLKGIRAKDWLNDVRLAHKDVASNFSEYEITYCGYSLGGLIGLVYQNQEVSFKRLLLLSPAISTVWYTKLLHVIAFTRHFGFSIYGKIPKRHRATRCTPIQCYYALSCLLNTFNSDFKLENFSSSKVIIYCHSKDELVSHSGVHNFVKKRAKNSWKFVSINPIVYIKHLFISKDLYLKTEDWIAFKKKLSSDISQL